MEYIKYCHGKWVNKYGNQYDQVIDKNEVMKSLEAETFETKTVFQKRNFANEHDDLINEESNYYKKMLMLSDTCKVKIDD